MEFNQVYQKIVQVKETNSSSSVSTHTTYNPLANFARDVENNVYTAIIFAFLTILALLAKGVMFFMEIAHTFLLNVEYAFIPALLGFIAHPQTAYLGYGILTSFIGIQLWIPGIAVVTRVNQSLMEGAFVGLATDNSPAALAFGAVPGAAAPLLGYFVLFGLFSMWVIFTLLAVPVIVGRIIRGSGFAHAYGGAGLSGMQRAAMIGMSFAGAAIPGGATSGMMGALAGGSAASSGRGGTTGGSSGSSSSGGGLPPITSGSWGGAGSPEAGRGGGGTAGGSTRLNQPPPEINSQTGKSAAANQSGSPKTSAAPAPTDQPPRKPMGDAQNPYSEENRSKTLDAQKAEILATMARRG